MSETRLTYRSIYIRRYARYRSIQGIWPTFPSSYSQYHHSGIPSSLPTPHRKIRRCIRSSKRLPSLCRLVRYWLHYRPFLPEYLRIRCRKLDLHSRYHWFVLVAEYHYLRYLQFEESIFLDHFSLDPWSDQCVRGPDYCR